jgi:hypothetical protein
MASSTSAQTDFYPPRPNSFLIGLGWAISKPVAHWHYKLDLEIASDSLERLQALKGKRCLLLPNHPTFQDPIVVFLLSARLRQPFYYLAAYEQFQGMLGPIFQGLGVYSIRRGIADRPSIAQTLELMTQPNCRLVIFPEGGCSFQNDTVMPFRAGAVQIAFQALNRFAKRGEELPDFWVVPVSIKYHYTRDMMAAIQKSLHQLEQALGIHAEGGDYERLRAIAERVLANLEQEYGVSDPALSQQPWNERIARLKAEVLQKCEQQLALTSYPGEPDRERVYRIQNAVESPDELLEQDSATQTAQTEKWSVDFVQKAMFRLLNFDAIYDGYVSANPTQERFLDTLTRLERDVFNINQPPPKGHRIARLKVGEPVNLKDAFDAYQKNRSQTINQFVMGIQQTVQENLNG